MQPMKARFPCIRYWSAQIDDISFFVTPGVSLCHISAFTSKRAGFLDFTLIQQLSKIPEEFVASLCTEV